MFQHWPLLDVKFDVSQNSSPGAALEISFGSTQNPESLSEQNALLILAAEKFLIHSAHQRATSDEGNSKPHSLFLRKTNDLDPKGSFIPSRDFTSPTASTTPNIPSNAPAFGTVSRCDPTKIRGTPGDTPG